MVRVLAYDRKMRSRAGDRVDIGILATAEEDQVVVDVLGGLTELRMHGLPVATHVLTVSDLEKSLETLDIDALFIGAGLDGQLSVITTLSRAANVMTITRTEEYVWAGVAVGVVRSDTGHRVLVNLPAARAEGSALDPPLLALAEVIR